MVQAGSGFVYPAGLTMTDRIRFAPLLAALAACALMAAAPRAGLGATQQAAPADSSAAPSGPAPSPEAVRALMARMVENQHRNDRALEEYERIERTVTRKAGPDSPVVSERTDLVMPTGTGVIRFPAKTDGSPPDAESSKRNIEFVIHALELAQNPDDHEKQDFAKLEKRRRERADLVNETGRAFRVTFLGREERDSHVYGKYLLEPDPNFKPSARFGSLFEHVRATVWVDESAAQVVRIEADIATDANFGAGILGKVYHGGHFEMDQAEAAPGVWLPTRYKYDFSGRKFLFGFEMHELSQISRYRRLGTPSDALAAARRELQTNPSNAAGDP